MLTTSTQATISSSWYFNLGLNPFMTLYCNVQTDETNKINMSSIPCSSEKISSLFLLKMCAMLIVNSVSNCSIFNHLENFFESHSCYPHRTNLGSREKNFGTTLPKFGRITIQLTSYLLFCMDFILCVKSVELLVFLISE